MKFTRHARHRMKLYGISQEEVEAVACDLVSHGLGDYSICLTNVPDKLARYT